MSQRYLTKSRFKLARECPTKLFYTQKSYYTNTKNIDTFLQALAQGGFQVGELAKVYFPTGIEIETKDNTLALELTKQQLQKEDVVIFEACLVYENLLVRVDVLEKIGNQIKLYEVKAKSIDPNNTTVFLDAKNQPSSTWQPYLEDIAFQKFVAIHALPDCQISAYLMLVDKTALCPTDGLNQKFKVHNYQVEVGELTPADLTPELLAKINVDDICDSIFSRKYDFSESFSAMVHRFSQYYTHDTKITTPISVSCAKCEYRNDEDFIQSGFHECWQGELNWTKGDFDITTIFEVGGLRNKDKFIANRKIKLTDLIYEDIVVKKPTPTNQRQWLQVSKYQNNDDTAWLDKQKIQQKMNSFTFPLHFIDFETTLVAIPFNAGRRPYEGIAFQFSHHTISVDGKVEHTGQFLHTEVGSFPNYAFVRELKSQLETDNGTIFCYANHENTFLRHILEQLENDPTVSDSKALCDFILEITQESGKGKKGSRNMVDMCQMVKDFYYDPMMKGSNSIKKVLPAILNGSSYLKQTYNQPIYGANDGIKSLNFKDWCWIEFDATGKVIDPYQKLPKLFEGMENLDDLLSNDDALNDGGGAMTAYARLQFETMSDYERHEIEQALLKYCELDTLAMVMLYQGWQDLLTV